MNRFIQFLRQTNLLFVQALIIFLLAILPACQTLHSTDTRAQVLAMQEAIPKELPGDYFIGRRMYKVAYKMWGWIRKPGQHWKDAQFVMLNEQKMLAPDRSQNKIGCDNNYEYRLEGYFSDQLVYEPASDHFYPEFVLLKASVISTSPANIYRYKEQLNPSYRLLIPPHI